MNYLKVIEGILLMIIVSIYKENVEEFAGLTLAIDFEVLKKRLRLYFKNVGEVKARLFAGEIINLPYVTLQKDRRIRPIKVSDERRKNLTYWQVNYN